MGIKQTWNIKLHIKTRHLPCIKARKGNPIEFPKLAEESETAPTPTDRNVYRQNLNLLSLLFLKPQKNDFRVFYKRKWVKMLAGSVI